MAMTPVDFLNWLITPDGLGAALAFLMAVVLPDLIGKGWEELIPPRFQRLALVGLELVLTVLTILAMRFLFGIPITQEVVWTALGAMFVVYTGGALVTGARKRPATREWRAAKQAMADGRPVVAVLSGSLESGRAMVGMTAKAEPPYVVSKNMPWSW